MNSLRILLLFCACVWGAAIFGVFCSWTEVMDFLEGFGLKAEIRYDPMLDYWLRMISGAFSLLGGAFFALALNPRQYWTAIPLFGFLMVGEGLILLFSGLRLHLSWLPFVADTMACLSAGLGILWLWRKANVK